MTRNQPKFMIIHYQKQTIKSSVRIEKIGWIVSRIRKGSG